ncbi:hypothetical protein PR048_029382 [Dryococelus australis]|uniref:Uncharacterized protein n=1 Tax=Dryococelus australis TaxID=614101 RepID=A0ABQ9GG69_9NEOP|nr:hypothetical protein PR048_029382 [Dryococelus australis]
MGGERTNHQDSAAPVFLSYPRVQVTRSLLDDSPDVRSSIYLPAARRAAPQGVRSTNHTVLVFRATLVGTREGSQGQMPSIPFSPSPHTPPGLETTDAPWHLA